MPTGRWSQGRAQTSGLLLKSSFPFLSKLIPPLTLAFLLSILHNAIFSRERSYVFPLTFNSVFEGILEKLPASWEMGKS